MVEANSTVRTTIIELYETANWITERLTNPEVIKEEGTNGIKELESKIDSLLPIAEKYDRSFRADRPLLDDEISNSLEHAALNLWNCTAIAIKAEKDHDKGQILCCSKLFASILLSVFEILRPSNEKKLMTLKCYLVVFKLVIDRDWVKLMKRVQELLENSLGNLDSVIETLEKSQGRNLEKMRFEFLLLNFSSCVKRGDLETARIYSSRAGIAENYELLDASTLLELCRIIYNAAIVLNDCHNVTSVQNAISLLRDVQTYLELPVTDIRSHPEYSNIKFMSLLFLTDCLIEIDPGTWDSSECHKNINKLQDVYPKKAESFILAIKLIKKTERSDNEETIFETIMKMVMSVDIVCTFDAVISSINDFASMNTKKAVQCLDYIFLNKLNPEKDQKWLDKIVVTRFFTTTQATTMTNFEIVESLKDFCGLIERRLVHIPPKHVISSIITLLWNSGKKLEKGGCFRESIGYFKLALNDLLSKNYEDRAKVQRALQNIYINIDEFSEAAEIYENMDTRDKESPLSQLLLLRVYLHAQDEEMAFKCLDKIKNSGQENAIDVFIVAAAECKRCSNLAVRGIVMLFEMIEDKDITEKSCLTYSFSTACLLRYTVQMILKMAEDNPQEVFTKYLDTLHSLLKNGVFLFKRFKVLETLEKKFKKGPLNGEVISVDEVEWFASTSYNIALQCRKRMDERHAEFAFYSLQYIKMIPTEEFTGSKLLHYLYWKFRASLLSIDTRSKLLRSGDKCELSRLQDDCGCLIDEIIEKLNDHSLSKQCPTEQLAKINECFVDALAASFEVALSARDQVKIRDILKNTAISLNSQIEELLIESATSFTDLPRGTFCDILETIIERNIANAATGNHLICSWLISLLDASSNVKEHLQRDLTNRVLARLRATFNPADSNVSILKQQLEMLATLNWNEGVRCIIRGDKQAGSNWCANSIGFANFANEALEGNLKAMWVSLASSANIEEHELTASHET